MSTEDGKNWLDIVKKEFDHPAIVLWRAVELRHIEAFLNKYALEKPILDLGCAEGKIANMFLKGKDVIGLDNCWELIKENRKVDTYKAVVLADACNMPFKEGVFGSVFSNCVIEHIPDIESLFKEISRVLKDGGIVLFSVPSHRFGDFLFFSTIFNNLSLKSLACWYSAKRNGLLNHFHCYDHLRWSGILKENALLLVDYDYYMTKKTTFVWDFLAILWRVLSIICPSYSFLKKISRYVRRFLERVYLVDGEEGGALLLVARKNTAF